MKRVLVVEDDANERFTLMRVLERVGYMVTAVSTAEEALAALPGSQFHAVVSDVMMPETDGVSLARDIAERAPGMPIILVSAFHLAPRQVDRMRIATLHFMDKPLDLPKLIALLEAPSGAPCERCMCSVEEALISQEDEPPRLTGRPA
jgi:DNA-binding NtrC family response regulator